jgi:hypothetical protein
VLILTPLAVAQQTVKEGAKIDVEIKHRREGVHSNDKIIVTNYERLHYYNPDDFEGVICDESSILKNFAGRMRDEITSFVSHHKYRLLCTATPSPNDYIELGTSSEALGNMRRVEMLGMYFVNAGDDTQKWRLKKHAHSAFWYWMCTWARALQKPSDLGFSDDRFILPKLHVNQHTVAISATDGYLFEMPAIGLDEQRREIRRSTTERCELAKTLVSDTGNPFVIWCNLNSESEALAKLIPDAVEIKGSDSEEKKEQAFSDFAEGKIRGLITKSSIAGFGMNWQHCAHQIYFPSHSYEQYYQAIRRCWRFGQKRPVTVDVITTQGQSHILENLTRKTEQSMVMFDQMVKHMRDEITKTTTVKTEKERMPSWLE